jgi:hypothetical protein
MEEKYIKRHVKRLLRLSAWLLGGGRVLGLGLTLLALSLGDIRIVGASAFFEMSVQHMLGRHGLPAILA